MLHDVRFTQNPQMLADERLTAAESLYQLVNKVVALGQKMDYLQAGRGVKGFKNLGRTGQFYGVNESYRGFMLVSMGGLGGRRFRERWFGRADSHGALPYWCGHRRRWLRWRNETQQKHSDNTNVKNGDKLLLTSRLTQLSGFDYHLT